jgi:hypothetical protein
VTTVANVVYKPDVQWRIGFFLHLFTHLQNNLLALLLSLFTSVIPHFESLALVAILANPTLSLVFITPRTPSPRILDRRTSLKLILPVIFSVLCTYIPTVQAAITANIPAKYAAKFINLQTTLKTD